MKCPSAVWLLCVAAHLCLAKILPDDVPSCSRSDPKIESCLLNAIDKMRPYLPNGWPRARIPAFEPFTVSELKVDRRLQIGSSVKATVSNISAVHFSEFRVDKLKFDPATLSGEYHVSYPFMRFSSVYDIDGEIVGVPLVGRGGTDGNFTDVRVALIGSLKEIVKDGVKHLKLDKIKSRIRVGDARATITSEHPQNVRTAQAVAKLFNDNPHRILDILYPLIEETYDVVMKKILNRPLTTIPMEEILTD